MKEKLKTNKDFISKGFAQAINTDNKEEISKWHKLWLYFGGLESGLYDAALASNMNPALYEQRFFGV